MYDLQRLLRSHPTYYMFEDALQRRMFSLEARVKDLDEAIEEGNKSKLRLSR